MVERLEQLPALLPHEDLISVMSGRGITVPDEDGISTTVLEGRLFITRGEIDAILRLRGCSSKLASDLTSQVIQGFRVPRESTESPFTQATGFEVNQMTVIEESEGGQNKQKQQKTLYFLGQASDMQAAVIEQYDEERRVLRQYSEVTSLTAIIQRRQQRFEEQQSQKRQSKEKEEARYHRLSLTEVDHLLEEEKSLFSSSNPRRVRQVLDILGGNHGLIKFELTTTNQLADLPQLWAVEQSFEETVGSLLTYAQELTKGITKEGQTVQIKTIGATTDQTVGLLYINGEKLDLTTIESSQDYAILTSLLSGTLGISEEAMKAIIARVAQQRAVVRSYKKDPAHIVGVIGVAERLTQTDIDEALTDYADLLKNQYALRGKPTPGEEQPLSIDSLLRQSSYYKEFLRFTQLTKNGGKILISGTTRDEVVMTIYPLMINLITDVVAKKDESYRHITTALISAQRNNKEALIATPAPGDISEEFGDIIGEALEEKHITSWRVPSMLSEQKKFTSFMRRAIDHWSKRYEAQVLSFYEDIFHEDLNEGEEIAPLLLSLLVSREHLRQLSETGETTIDQDTLTRETADIYLMPIIINEDRLSQILMFELVSSVYAQQLGKMKESDLWTLQDGMHVLIDQFSTGEIYKCIEVPEYNQSTVQADLQNTVREIALLQGGESVQQKGKKQRESEELRGLRRRKTQLEAILSRRSYSTPGEIENRIRAMVVEKGGYMLLSPQSYDGETSPAYTQAMKRYEKAIEHNGNPKKPNVKDYEGRENSIAYRRDILITNAFLTLNKR